MSFKVVNELIKTELAVVQRNDGSEKLYMRKRSANGKYDYKSLEEHFVKIENKLNVITESNDDGLNLDSKIIHETALNKNIKSVYVPRAVVNCRRKNVCYTGCASGAKQEGYWMCSNEKPTEWYFVPLEYFNRDYKQTF